MPLDVPQYLVYYRWVGNETDDPHLGPTVRTQERISNIYLLDEPGPPDAPLSLERCRLFQDQAIFVRASLFRQVGGFEGVPLMEDLDLIRRLKKIGRIENIKEPVITSARRYEALGPFRATMINKVTLLSYWLKVSQERLEKFYYRISRSSR